MKIVASTCTETSLTADIAGLANSPISILNNYGEMWLRMIKTGKTGMHACGDTDVRIAVPICN